MKAQLFVVGDIHGEYGMLEELLKKWDRETQTLLFIGDLADRGPESLKCFETVYRFTLDGEAICLTGNHEQILLNFLREPERYFGNYLLNGGSSTISTLVPEWNQTHAQAHEVAHQIIERHPELVLFIKNLPLYYEWGNYLFVHAGVDLSRHDWHETQESDFYWIREPFHQGKNRTGKVIVFGHTPTPLLHQENDNFELWESDDKIGIDGGAVYGGILHGIVLNREKMIAHYGVKKIDGHLQTIEYM